MSPFILFSMGLKHLSGDTKLKVTAKNIKPNTRYTIQVQNITNGTSTASPGRARGTSFIQTVQADTRGVTKVTIKNPQGETVRSYIGVGSAEIDCCIAKLVHDAINCTCKCNKCKEDLERAQTVRFAFKAASYDANLGLQDGANDKYKKAKELCTEVCACGC